MKRREAFTLVELLVVIAIIVILIAILLPTLRVVREQSMQLQCQSNLRQLGQAMTMYTQQFGFFPGGTISENRINIAEVWPVRLRKFLKGNQAVFYCPTQDPRCQWKADAPGPVIQASEVHTNFGYELGERLLLFTEIPGMFFSYGYNGGGAAGLTPPNRSVVRGMGGFLFEIDRSSFHRAAALHRAGSVKSPSEFMIIADTTADGIGDHVIDSYPIGPGYHYSPANIHRGGANVLFFDGHVQWRLQKDLTLAYPPVPQEASRQRMWNIDNQPAEPW